MIRQIRFPTQHPTAGYEAKGFSLRAGRYPRAALNDIGMMMTFPPGVSLELGFGGRGSPNVVVPFRVWTVSPGGQEMRQLDAEVQLLGAGGFSLSSAARGTWRRPDSLPSLRLADERRDELGSRWARAEQRREPRKFTELERSEMHPTASDELLADVITFELLGSDHGGMGAALAAAYGASAIVGQPGAGIPARLFLRRLGLCSGVMFECACPEGVEYVFALAAHGSHPEGA